jgi:Mrp family chromosome partitioning ATPase
VSQRPRTPAVPVPALASVERTANYPSSVLDAMMSPEARASNLPSAPGLSPAPAGPAPATTRGYQPPAASPAPAAPTAPAASSTAAAAADPSLPPLEGIEVALFHGNAPPGGGRLLFIHESDSLRAASYRVLRQRLRENGNPRVIAVTSPKPREGKTRCAIDLAMSLAEHGRGRVLLVETHLRSPRIAKALGFEPPTCFADQMAQHQRNPRLPWRVAAAFFPSFHVLALAPNAGNWLLHEASFSLANEQLRRAGYSHIVLDCPPVLESADVNILSDFADGVLFAAHARSTTGDSLRDAAKQLAPANILGTVLLND